LRLKWNLFHGFEGEEAFELEYIVDAAHQEDVGEVWINGGVI